MKQLIENSKLKLVSLLRKSERFTKTDMVYLAHGVSWLILGQTVSSLSALALAVAFANLVSPETYGTYKYLLSIAGMFAIFSLPGMGTAVSRAVAKGHSGVIYAATNSRIKTSIIGAILALAGSAYYFVNANVELSVALLIIAVTLPFFDTFTLYLSYLVGKRRFDIQTKYHVFSQIVSIPVLVATIALTENILLILLAYFLPLAIVRFFLYLRTIRATPRGTDTDEQKETLTYGKHLTVMQILGIIAGNIDKILLWKFLGPVQLAIYAFAIAIPEQIRGPLKGMSNIMLPKFAEQSSNGDYRTPHAFWYKFLLYSALLGAISLVYIALAPLLFGLFFPTYTSSVFFSQILALSLITGAQSMPATLLTAHGRVKTQYMLSVIRSTVQITLLIVMIPMFGIMGAIIATIIANVVNLISTIIAVVVR